MVEEHEAASHRRGQPEGDGAAACEERGLIHRFSSGRTHQKQLVLARQAGR